jgi:hypothetical protein
MSEAGANEVVDELCHLGRKAIAIPANTVVHHRMKRPGRGWKRTNAEAMLAGRSELHCNRFLDSWQAALLKVA